MGTLCRLCACQSSSLESVYSIVKGQLLADLITAICPVKIDVNDELPKKICIECQEIIISANELRVISVSSDINFRKNDFFAPWKPVNETLLLKKEGDDHHPAVNEESPTEKIQPEHERALSKRYRPRRKASTSEHICVHCAKLFRNLSAYIKHVRNIHGLFHYRPFKCSLCGFSQWTKSRIEQHQKIHHRGMTETFQFSCDYCTAKTNHKIELEEHMIATHVENRMKVSLVSTPKYLLQTTKKTADNSLNITGEINQPYRQRRETSQSEYVCFYCMRPFASISAHIKHIRDLHGFFHYQPYMCSLCSFGQWTKIRIEKHQKIHHPRVKEFPRFRCDNCPITTRHKGELEEHIIAKHDKSRKHVSKLRPKYYYRKKRESVKCPSCNYFTPHPSNYRRHLQDAHGIKISLKHSGLFQAVQYDIESLLCDQCSVNFDSIRALRKHMREVHKYEPPKLSKKLVCHICSKVYTGNSVLLKHLKTHEADAYRCYACPKTFKFPENCRRHEMIHDPEHLSRYRCDQCSKSYAEMKSLNNHILTFHLKKQRERNHCCTFCDMKFFRGHNLRRHIMTHTGEVSVYLCNVDLKQST